MTCKTWLNKVIKKQITRQPILLCPSPTFSTTYINITQILLYRVSGERAWLICNQQLSGYVNSNAPIQVGAKQGRSQMMNLCNESLDRFFSYPRLHGQNHRQKNLGNTQIGVCWFSHTGKKKNIFLRFKFSPYSACLSAPVIDFLIFLPNRPELDKCLPAIRCWIGAVCIKLCDSFESESKQ